MTLAAGKTLAYARFGAVILYVSATNPPSDHDWAEYAAWLTQIAQPGARILSIVYERGGGPNAVQRKQINEITSRCSSLQVAVVTTSAMARGVVTALSWFKDGFKAFQPSELDQAIAFLNIPSGIAVQVRQAITQMKSDLDR